jgi:hypothetical protein
VLEGEHHVPREGARSGVYDRDLLRVAALTERLPQMSRCHAFDHTRREEYKERMTNHILTSPEEIIAACEAGGIVVFLGNDPPFDEDSDDNLVACKVMGPVEEQTFWVIGSQENRERVTEYACVLVQRIGGTVTSLGRVH